MALNPSTRSSHGLGEIDGRTGTTTSSGRVAILSSLTSEASIFIGEISRSSSDQLTSMMEGQVEMFVDMMMIEKKNVMAVSDWLIEKSL